MEKILKFQDDIQRELGDRYKIFVSRVIYTQLKGGILSMTFFDFSELSEFLDLVKYNSLCDKSEITIFRDTKTVILIGYGLEMFYKLFENEYK